MKQGFDLKCFFRMQQGVEIEVVQRSNEAYGRAEKIDGGRLPGRQVVCYEACAKDNDETTEGIAYIH